MTGTFISLFQCLSPLHLQTFIDPSLSFLYSRKAHSSDHSEPLLFLWSHLPLPIWIPPPLLNFLLPSFTLPTQFSFYLGLTPLFVVFCSTSIRFLTLFPITAIIKSLHLPPHILNWLHPYLVNQHQSVLINGISSPPFTPTLAFPKALSLGSSSSLSTSTT